MYICSEYEVDIVIRCICDLIFPKYKIYCRSPKSQLAGKRLKTWIEYGWMRDNDTSSIESVVLDCRPSFILPRAGIETRMSLFIGSPPAWTQMAEFDPGQIRVFNKKISP